MLVDIYTKDGQVGGQVELSDDVFGITPNENAMHQAVVAHLAHKRQGTRKTKIRSEVRGGGKKPWRQKGRGTARAGSTRSPIWVGGGTIHGPKAFEYVYKLPKKLSRLARKSAYSLRMSENNLKVVEDFAMEEIKTKSFAQFLKNLELEGQKTLVILPGADRNVYMSGRNIPKVSVKTADGVSAYEILNHKKVLVFKDAVAKIEESFGITVSQGA